MWDHCNYFVKQLRIILSSLFIGSLKLNSKIIKRDIRYCFYSLNYNLSREHKKKCRFRYIYEKKEKETNKYFYTFQFNIIHFQLSIVNCQMRQMYFTNISRCQLSRLKCKMPLPTHAQNKTKLCRVVYFILFVIALAGVTGRKSQK